MSRFAVLVALLFATAVVQAAGSAEAGKQKSLTCSACHGADGNSLNPEWPSLAGQNTRYAVRQLLAYKGGERQNVLMSGMALGLSEQDIEDLAAYYAAQPVVLRTADPALVALGQQIYRGGLPERGVPACSACHGPKGVGNPLAGYPVVRGQHATYTAVTLREYASGTRKTDSTYNQMMRNIAAGLEEDEIIALASYIQGLR
jgi:cytochrome c553